MVLFYNTYFKEAKKTEIDNISNEKKIDLDNEIKSKDGNNLIKNLKYNVTFDNNKEYIINSDFSEITYTGPFTVSIGQQQASRMAQGPKE